MRRFSTLWILMGLLAMSENVRSEEQGPLQLTYNPDVDLQDAPSYYRDRVLEFRELLRKESTQEQKIKKAVSLIADPRSKYRNDAIDFVAEVHAEEAVSVLQDVTKDANVREFAIYALGQIPRADSVPLLIRYLSDTDKNVRGNSQLAIEKITREKFSYHYYDRAEERKAAIGQIEKWWKENQSQFQARRKTEEEKRQAEEAWRKYGRRFIHDLRR